jgi:predicted nucleic acid-binding Zn ribbon protein
MKDDPITVCPSCKGQVKRHISGGLGVIFKGSGFYSTDNKRSSVTTGEVSKSTAAKDDKKEEKKEEKPAPESKSDKKDEKKSA